MKNIFSILISIMVVLSSYTFTMAQDVAPPIPAEPQRLETPQATAPMDLRAEDAAALIEQMKASSGQPGASAPVVQGGPASSPSSGNSYTIMLKPPQVVNASPLFQFRDVTNRSLSGNTVLPINKRSSAVEAYRQSVISEKK
jgi:hypothetical protein